MQELSVYYRAYREYLECMQGNDAHAMLMKALLSDANAEKGFSGRASQCQWDEDWIQAMLDALPYVERAVAEQRKFIVSHEEIRRIDQAKKTSVESVRHLAQHSNMISQFDGDEVIPDRVLIVEREDNYLIYENRFLYTLILRMQSFLDERLNAVAELNESTVQSAFMNCSATWNRKHLQASIHLEFKQRPQKLRGNVDLSEMTAQERISHLGGRMNDLANAPLMRLLKGATQVSVPIVRTNVFKKNVNFKRALELFEFLENYQKPGYEILCAEPESEHLSTEFRKDLCEGIAFESFILRLNAQRGIREQLEENYNRENELAERERIRQEEERERAVQARIAEARAEEIAIREFEIAKREEIIETLSVKLENKENEVARVNRELADTIKRHANELENLICAQAEELARVRSECERSVQKIGGERDKLQAALDTQTARMQAECADRLKEQRAVLKRQFEGRLSKERANAQSQLERQEKKWNLRIRKQKEDMERRMRKILQTQQDENDKKLAALQRDLEKSRSKLDSLEIESQDGDGRSKLRRFLKR